MRSEEWGRGLAGHCEACGFSPKSGALWLVAELGLKTQVSFFRTKAPSSTTPFGLAHIPVPPQPDSGSSQLYSQHAPLACPSQP